LPKIIENLREQLLAEAKRQITENGYAKTTVRSVASACGVGVGTVYNYFPSKDMLIASFMAEDWLIRLKRMKSLGSVPCRDRIFAVYTELREYTEEYGALFGDSDAAKVFATVFSERHGQLRGQIAEVVLPLCDKYFLAEFIGEAMLAWTVAGKDFDALYEVIEKLLT